MRDILEALKTIESKLDIFREEYVREHERLAADTRRSTERLEIAERNIQRHESELAELRKIVQETHLYQKLLVGIVGFIGAGLGTWLIAQFMGLLK